jgi:tRNA U34 5-carboxymethylaminomethyl modifying GTPase MnmE/TrmE
MVGKSKNRKRAAEHFKKFSKLLRLLINVNRNTTLHRKGMEIATFLPIAAGKFSLLSYWLVSDIWAFPSGFPIPFRNFPKADQ